MIISQLYKGQGLGNQLWCMATAYTIAQKKKFPLCVLDKNNEFLGKEIFDFPQKVFFNQSIIKNYFYEQGYYHPKLKTYIYDFDPDIMNVSPQTEIIGNFQSEKYFFEFKNSIKSFFQIKPKIQKLSEQFHQYNVLNIRGGEYKRHKNLLLHDSYWGHVYNFMKKKSNLPTLCVSDDYRYAKKLFPHLEVISNDIEQCFAAIMGAANIALSNSSFSYFPIFLGQPKSNIFAPYQWARFHNSDDLWCSPCNFYPQWQWVNFHGQIISRDQCSKNVLFTLDEVKQKCPKISFPKPKKEKPFVKFLKDKIKLLLGLFHWRYQ